MEQRTDPIIPSIPPAGTDPAYIPGITPARPVAPAKPAPAPAKEPAAAVPATFAAPKKPEAKPAKAAKAEADTGTAPDAEVEVEAAVDAEIEVDADTDAEQVPYDGPVFTVSDRRSSITADGFGVTLRLDGEEAEFPWDEIGAVEIDTPRFGRRFSITVYTTGRRWYEADVEASSRSLLKQWTAELDAVLDACFEEPDAADSADADSEDATDKAADA